MSLKWAPFLPKSIKDVSPMRMQKFFGRITIYAIMLFVLVLVIFVFEAIYSVVIYFQLSIGTEKDVTKLNGIPAYILAILLSILLFIFIIRWVRKHWRESANDVLPNSESEQLQVIISRLNSRLDKLDKLDKLDRLDRLIKVLEEREKREQEVKHKKR